MNKYRWIMYIQENFPGNTSFQLMRVESLTQAREEFWAYGLRVRTNDCSATLYPYSDEAWADAEDFRTAGRPFDHPSRIIESGPRGGIRVLIMSKEYAHCDRCGCNHPGQLVRHLATGAEEALCFTCWNPIRQACKVLDWINKHGKLQHGNR